MTGSFSDGMEDGPVDGPWTDLVLVDSLDWVQLWGSVGQYRLVAPGRSVQSRSVYFGKAILNLALCTVATSTLH